MIRQIIITVCLFISTSVLSQEKKAQIVINTPTKCNHCKICETCGQKLETDLYYVRGIKIVEYNEKDQTTTIVYKPKLINPDRIREEIAKLGFDADDVKADDIAYEKRDRCCK